MISSLPQSALDPPEKMKSLDNPAFHKAKPQFLAALAK